MHPAFFETEVGPWLKGVEAKYGRRVPKHEIESWRLRKEQERQTIAQSTQSIIDEAGK
jgi:hypothetical protein